jgi:hypothetical protein
LTFTVDCATFFLWTWCPAEQQMKFKVGDIVSRNGRVDTHTYLVVGCGKDDMGHNVYDALDLISGKHIVSYLPDYLFTLEA